MHQYNKQNFRQQGRSVDGRLAKGFIQSAHNKSISGSIPSKYETILMKNDNAKAFGTSTSRFCDNRDYDVPAPGQYAKMDQSTTFSTIDTNNSISKKGYGNGFVSQTTRTTFQNKYANMGPGPGSYEPKGITKDSKAILGTQSGRGTSSFLSKSAATLKMPQSASINKMTPGPSTYQLGSKDKNGNYSKSYLSSFISQTKRGQYMDIKNNPGAGQYNIKRSLVNKKLYPHIGVSSYFQPPVDKDAYKNPMMKLTQFIKDKDEIEVQGRLVKENKDKKIQPGPGQYEQQLPDFKSEHLKYSLQPNFKASIKDRFGQFHDSSKEEGRFKTPGPDHYKVEELIGLAKNKQKAVIKSHFFMDQQDRGFYKDVENKMGPNTELPYKAPLKKSYNLNLDRKWV